MSIAGKIVTAAFKPGIIQKIVKPSTPGAAVAVATVSCVSKDAINCYYYVTQSLKNDKIPEDKRKFVAGLDLANGILNVTVQSALAFGVKKLSDWYTEKKFLPKYFSDENIKKLHKLLKTSSPLEKFAENMATIKILAKTGIGVISALVATQIIAKRVIVPFLATPMASYFKEKFEANEKNKNGQPTTDTTQITFRNAPPKVIMDRPLPDCFKQFK